MNEDAPQVIAPDVHLIRSLPPTEGSLRIAINSLVLGGPDPVLVDTGAASGRSDWWRQVESVIDPDDVRWIFLSHDDVDHYGNLFEALERCPHATVVSSWLIGKRLEALAPLPQGRCRWVDDGDRFTLGARELVAVRPPAYDSPTTRGLYDLRSRVYWAADCFGVPLPHQVDEVADLDRDAWEDGTLLWHRLLSPWAADIDPVHWRRAVARVGSLDLHAITSAHGPLVARRQIVHALDLVGELPGHPAVTLPGQSEVAAAMEALTVA